MMTREQLSKGVNELREMADEIRLKVHLASMDARSYWESVEPQLLKLERSLEEKGSDAIATVGDLFASVGAALRKLRDQLLDHTVPR